jgi:hypothetical protein
VSEVRCYDKPEIEGMENMGKIHSAVLYKNEASKYPEKDIMKVGHCELSFNFSHVVLIDDYRLALIQFKGKRFHVKTN